MPSFRPISHSCNGALVLLLASLCLPGQRQAWASRASGPELLCKSDPVCTKYAGNAQQLAQAGDYKGALRAYQLAFQTVPDPVLNIGIGRMYQKLGDYSTAISHYREYLDNEPLPGEPRDRAEEFLTQVQSQLALQQADKTARTAAEPTQNTAYGPSAMEGIRRSAPASVLIAPPPQAVRHPIYTRWWFWTVLGAAVVGAAAGITAGIVASHGPAPMDDLPTYRRFFPTPGP
jgi:tetratricopeptide (TPR) repeat protein